MSTTFTRRRLIPVGGLAAVGLFGGTAVLTRPTSARQSTPTAAPTVEPLVALVHRVGSAGVTVINLQTASGGTTDTSGGGGFDPGSGRLQPAGSGTGFIISDDGYIVTNWHVVTGGEEFQVTLSDGTTLDATLVGSDEISDLAVVQVDGDMPAVVGFGDSDQVQPGQSVLAIGSPLGAFTNTVTEGIVSATNRDFPTQQGSGTTQNYSDLIQHDAVINPGNSGGPLFDLAGQVIGVNTLGIPEVQGEPVQGLFFAIPSNEVKRVTGLLISDGEVTYPYLGIGQVSLTPELAAQNDLPVDYGAYVQQVVRGGPADDAGIRVDDIIVAIGGQAIDAQNSFTEVLFAQRVGDTVTVTVQRGDDQQDFDVTLAERPANL